MTKRASKKKRKLFGRKFTHPEKRSSRNWALILFGSLAMFLFFQRFVIGVGVVTDRSMLPTLSQESTFLINKYIFHFTQPQRGDIVVFRVHTLDEELYVKRVVGLAGERISFRNGKVFIDGQPLDEPYVKGRTYPSSNTQSLRIESGTVFVMGDNRTESQDSRQFGSVSFEKIEGKIQPGQWFPLR